MIDAAKVPVAELTVAVVPDVAGPSAEALKLLAKAFKEKRGRHPCIEPLPQEMGFPRTGAEFAGAWWDDLAQKNARGEEGRTHLTQFMLCVSIVLMHHAASHSIKYYSC